MRVHTGGVDGAEAALELAIAHALVRRASRGELGEVLRVYRPERPVAVFGRRDTRLPGFADAARAASDAGFVPLVRATGGRAVAYTGNAIVVDHVSHDPLAAAGLDHRFEEYGARLALIFRDLGIDARVGAVPVSTAPERTASTPAAPSSSSGPPSEWCATPGCSAHSWSWATSHD